MPERLSWPVAEWFAVSQIFVGWIGFPGLSLATRSVPVLALFCRPVLYNSDAYFSFQTPSATGEF